VVSEQTDTVSDDQPQTRLPSLRELTVGALILAALPAGLAIALGVSSDIEYVYLGEDRLLALGILVLLALLVLLPVLLITTVVQLFRKRWLNALALVIGCVVPFLLLGFWPIDREAWKFSRYRAEYHAIIQSESSPAAKFRIFNWGTRGGGFGSSTIYEAIVYDELDEITLAVHSPGWGGSSPDLPADVRWVIATLSPPYDLRCRRTVKPLGDHFYHVAEVC
jgi:hypothetical protein